MPCISPDIRFPTRSSCCWIYDFRLSGYCEYFHRAMPMCYLYASLTRRCAIHDFSFMSNSRLVCCSTAMMAIMLPCIVGYISDPLACRAFDCVLSFPDSRTTCLLHDLRRYPDLAAIMTALGIRRLSHWFLIIRNDPFHFIGTFISRLHGNPILGHDISITPRSFLHPWLRHHNWCIVALWHSISSTGYYFSKFQVSSFDELLFAPHVTILLLQVSSILKDDSMIS